MEEVKPNKHIVLFPFMAQGHITPFISLANLIHSTTQPNPPTITLLSTPLNIQTIQSTLPSSSPINLVPLPFDPVQHDLPPKAENTDSLPYSLILHLFHASKSLLPHFSHFLESLVNKSDPTRVCVVADVFFGWTVGIAREKGVFHVTFTTCGAFGTAAYNSLWMNLPHVNTDGDEFGLPGFPPEFRLRRNQLSQHLRHATDDNPWTVFIREQISSAMDSNALLCNTVAEIEETGMRILHGISNLPIYAVSPLLHSGRIARPIADKTCLTWLDSRPNGSVLYVSFGSQNTVSASQMTALAEGLEQSGVGFVWVVRPPIGLNIRGEFKTEWLPEGFEERVEERGLVVKGWAPQVEMLGHVAVGGFLSHGGWNSVLESLSKGVPLIGWPMNAEQFYNVKMLEEELGVCVEVARGAVEDVESRKIEAVVTEVMRGEKGSEMRRRVGELAGKIKAALRVDVDGKGSSVLALERFLEAALGQ